MDYYQKSNIIIFMEGVVFNCLIYSINLIIFRCIFVVLLFREFSLFLTCYILLIVTFYLWHIICFIFLQIFYERWRKAYGSASHVQFIFRQGQWLWC